MATEKRLIDANALDDAVVISQHRNPHEMPGDRAMHNHEHLHFRVMISQAPTVDAVEVVQGHWVSDEGDVLFHCSECETQISTSWDYDDLLWNYCPSCGALMD